MDPTAANALRGSAFLCILLLSVLLSYAIRRTSFKWATEGSVALLLGMATGAVMLLVHWLLDPHHRLPRRLVSFDEGVFLQVLLPPIIFSAGFSVKKKLFFRNFLTVVLFGVGGTVVTAAVLAAAALRVLQAVGLPRTGLLRTSLALGAVLSCTDSVAVLQLLSRDRERAPLTYSLLFGEGVVNDATAIVLLGAIANLPYNPDDEAESLSPGALGLLGLRVMSMFVLSMALGLGVGLLSGAVVRWLFRRHGGGGGGAGVIASNSQGHCTHRHPHHHTPHQPHIGPDPEVLAVALLGLLAYFLAEGLQLSAVLSVFFCGIAMSHYTWHSLGPAAKMITRHGLHVISSGCEVVLLVAAGLDVWATTAWWRPDPGPHPDRSLRASLLLAGVLLAALAATRAAVVFPLVAAANRGWRRREPVPAGGAAVLWWGGLPRGPITLALGYHCFYGGAEAGSRPDHQVAISAVIYVVVVTTVGLGVVAQPVLHAFMPRLAPRLPAPSRRRALARGGDIAGGGDGRTQRRSSGDGPKSGSGIPATASPTPTTKLTSRRPRARAPAGPEVEPRSESELTSDSGSDSKAVPTRAASAPRKGRRRHRRGWSGLRCPLSALRGGGGGGAVADEPVGHHDGGGEGEALRRPLLLSEAAVARLAAAGSSSGGASRQEGGDSRRKRAAAPGVRFAAPAAAPDPNKLLWMGEVPPGLEMSYNGGGSGSGFMRSPPGVRGAAGAGPGPGGEADGMHEAGAGAVRQQGPAGGLRPLPPPPLPLPPPPEPRRTVSFAGLPPPSEGPTSPEPPPSGDEGAGSDTTTATTATAATVGTTWVHAQWRRLDARWLQPLFGGSRADLAGAAAGAEGSDEGWMV